MVKRRDNERRPRGRFSIKRLKILFQRPALSCMGERHALRRACRSRRIQNFGQVVLARREGVKRSRIKHGLKTGCVIRIHINDLIQSLGEAAPFGVDDGEAAAQIF